jgi:ribosomal protein L11 methyltransferase
VRRALLVHFPQGVEERIRQDGVRFVVYAANAQQQEDNRSTLRALWPATVRVRAVVRKVDWQKRWVRSLGPQRLTSSTTVVPVASAARAERELAAATRRLPLLQESAFGFGEHATTRLMASELEQVLQRALPATTIDVGSGTGVLAILAARCGARRVLGIDIDAPSVRAARANAGLNGVARRCRFSLQPLQRVRGRFELVLANLELPVVEALARDLVRVLAPQGTLLISGVLCEHEAQVVQLLHALGASAQRVSQEDGWTLLACRRHGGAASGRGVSRARST